jgi:hypothetical protein
MKSYIAGGEGEYDYSQEAIDSLIDEATKNGFEVLMAEPKLLLLDLDSEEEQERFKEVVDDVFALLDLTIVSIDSRPSLGGKGIHVVIRLSEDLSPRERIIVQLALGSDYRREMHSLNRIWEGTKPFSMLIRKG